jgi:hypothetical protein
VIQKEQGGSDRENKVAMLQMEQGGSDRESKVAMIMKKQGDSGRENKAEVIQSKVDKIVNKVVFGQINAVVTEQRSHNTGKIVLIQTEKGSTYTEGAS